MHSALIFAGGWEGHAPFETARLFAQWLIEADFAVEIADSLDCLDQPGLLAAQSLIVPIWTMGSISESQSQRVCDAVAAGCGLAGCHGGMCDAFRHDVSWQFMTGGNWVAHPGNDSVTYTVEVRPSDHPITRGITDFSVLSEQYYLHVDPAIEVHATTRFPIADGPHATNGPVSIPQVWTKRWGNGRVFYNALGHQPAIWNIPEARILMQRGLLWAANALEN
ncbi:MAG: hypothetical protein RL648_70 [Verrucomicrobiota bacterium]